MKAEKTRTQLKIIGSNGIEFVEEIQKLTELERLATMGHYTEMAFSDDNPLTYMRGLGMVINSVEELIEWGEEREGDNE